MDEWGVNTLYLQDDGNCTDYNCAYGYNERVFEGCSSLSLKARKKIRDAGYKGEF